MSEAAIIVPCFNEARRLPLEQFRRYLTCQADTRFLFVDDGSTDNTAARIESFCISRRNVAHLIRLPENRGKAEAVRRGMLAALDDQPDYVGFWDADLATPLSAIDELRQVLDQRAEVQWVFGSRVRLLGRSIHRLPTRHYLGRAWATAVSLLLRLPVYDTQCGAKLFRATDELRQILSRPFLTRWVFDVELIARLIRARRGTQLPAAERVIYEFPLCEWRDVAGSKLKARDFWRGGFELLKIYWHYLGRGEGSGSWIHSREFVAAQPEQELAASQADDRW
jgi:glycosyltransferase involved in cell wall biosynthesis